LLRTLTIIAVAVALISFWLLVLWLLYAAR
jgi:hypothetical protein